MKSFVTLCTASVCVLVEWISWLWIWMKRVKSDSSFESDYKMSVFLELKSRDQLTTLMMEAAGLSEKFIYVYQCTRHCLPGDIILQWNISEKSRVVSICGVIG